MAEPQSYRKGAKMAGDRAQSLLLENENILPGIFMKNFVTYKQVTELLPDPKRALLGSSVLEFRGVLDHRALESQSARES